MKLKLFFVITVSLLFAVEGNRLDLLNDFLRLGVNARVQALGNGGMIASEGAESVFYNPSLMMISGPKNDLLISYTPQYFDTSYAYGFYDLYYAARRLKLGIGGIVQLVNDVEYRTAKTDSPTRYTLYHYIVTGGIARVVSRGVALGVNVNYSRSNYSDNTQGLYFTVGLHRAISRSLLVAFTAKIHQSGETVFSAGWKVTPSPLLSLYFTGNYYKETTFTEFTTQVGGSYSFSPELLLHAGYNEGQLSSGVTLMLDQLKLNYSIILTDLGVRHNVSVSL
jgi:hypothetical protein